ncbi:MAG: hypothetical protein AB1656_24890 [Candidatus Omnitrophota bacterium]
MLAKNLMVSGWYADQAARQRNEPGIAHSFMGGLATALNYMHGEVDPVWLMGSSAWAFRIWISQAFCPSAMSVFDWNLLPEAVVQAGYSCVYISRLWNEKEKEEERREQAYEAIFASIEQGAPAVVWDIADDEWGLITGFDDERQSYSTLSCHNEIGCMPYEKLGRNGIDILSVTIPGQVNGRTRKYAVRRSLEAAVAHAEQKEWMDRPKYQDGLPAFDLWAASYDRWLMLVEAGKSDNITKDLPKWVKYFAGHWYGARCYAREYLRTLVENGECLSHAAEAYAKTAECLKPVWLESPSSTTPEKELLSMLAQCIRNAKTAEEEGIEHIRQYLAATKKSG